MAFGGEPRTPEIPLDAGLGQGLGRVHDGRERRRRNTVEDDGDLGAAENDRPHPLRAKFGRRRFEEGPGVLHFPRLHQRDSTHDQIFHVARPENDTIVPVPVQPRLVDAGGDGARGGQEADRTLADTAALHGGARGVDNVEHRTPAFPRQFVVPVVRGIARDGDAFRARLRKDANPAQHGRQRRGRALENARGTPGDLGHRVHDEGQVLLVPAGRSQIDDLAHEVDGGERSHAAQDSDHAAHISPSLRTGVSAP